MPRLIAAGEAGAVTLDECIEALAQSRIDVRDEDGFAALGPLLARLGRNRTFLADLAIAALDQRRDARMQGYGAQVMLLHPSDGRFALRANFWPAESDAALRASGTAAFFYGVPHDHNFPFLTYGYSGPGYRSDHWEYDGDALAGVAGEPAGLRFVGRARLRPGTLMLYRMGRDVHAQLPPDRLSVSLNILGYPPGQRWRDQYRFDTARNCIAETLTVASSEVLLSLACALGGDGRDLAEHFAARHPSDRMRLTATAALAGSAASDTEREAIWTRATASPVVRIAAHARRMLESGPVQFADSKGARRH